MLVSTACHAVFTAAATLVWLSAALAAPPPPPAGQDCQRTCGGVDIPFPFGNGPDHCLRHRGFNVVCRDAGNGLEKPFMDTNATVEVLDISLRDHQMRVLNHVSFYCGDNYPSTGEWSWNLTRSPFTFSNTANKFTVVGCRTLAYIGNDVNDAAAYQTGCVSMCRRSPGDLGLRNGSCSGMGCCQTAIPSGLQYYHVWFDRRLSASETTNQSESLCNYAVLTESSNFTFSTSYVTSSSELRYRQVPVVLDWAINLDGGCDVARTKPGYACASNNSQCIDKDGGYICKCAEGFQGNPYLHDGCQDINECDDPAKCFGECINEIGTFTCSCPAGTRGNPFKDECQKDPFPPRARLTIGVSAGLLVALMAFLTIEVFRNKQRNKRKGYFEQHGGQMLSRILKTEGIDFKFYDRGDIMKATRSFHKDNIVGEGAHGAVYKGILSVDGTTTTVAVKRCKQIDKSRTQEFVQELVILCRINHPNIVKLLGCCLHFEAPMLVYEFMPNGTLNDLLHGKPKQCVTLATRLRIAAEAAKALDYLHSPPHPTLHGDVKPENILLGEGWVAKVSDFGCSTLDDNVQVVPKGTLAYLAPELIDHFQITDKTDVYSLGVMLMELLTGKKPLGKEQKNLRIIFEEAMENGTLNELLDPDIIVEEGAMGVIHQVAVLASRCTVVLDKKRPDSFLAEKPGPAMGQVAEDAMGVIHQATVLASRCSTVPGKTRPGMRQVAEELQRLSNGIPEHYQALQDLEGPRHSNAADESETTGFSSVGTVAALSTELAR